MSGLQNDGFETDLVDGDTKEQTKHSKAENGNGTKTYTKTVKPSILVKLGRLIDKNRRYLNYAFIVILNIAVVVHYSFATNHYVTEVKDCDQKFCLMGWCKGYGMLTLLYGTIYIGLIYFQIIKPLIGKQFRNNIATPFSEYLKILFSTLTPKLIGIAIIVVGLAVYIFFETRDEPKRLRSLIGIASLFTFGFLFSKNRSKINWRPVILGLGLQFLLGIFCIRWEVGRDMFSCLGDKVATFLHYAHDGAEFVFGELLVTELRVFAFSVLSTIFFLSFCISILYYLGAMQWVIIKLGWILQSILGTTICESVVAPANIFLGMSESPLLIRPYLKNLTDSEIHSIMTSGFATVSGAVLAAYVGYGADPAHLVTASVMAAPASLSFSKLFYPETVASKTTSENMVLKKSTDTSILDAATNGANEAIKLVLGIIANTVAFVAFIAFVNAMINWLAVLVGEDHITFEWIFGKMFIPLSWVMGVPWDECDMVGEIIGTKTVINEFVAYEKLGKFKRAGVLSSRSAAIATYAVCGFANPSSLGIMIGNLSAMVPERRSAIVTVAMRAFVSGCCVCFMTASIAGLLMTDDILNALVDSTNSSNNSTVN